MDHDAIMWAARTEPLGPLRTEDRHNGQIQEVRKMHRAAVVANKKPTVRKYGQKTTKIEIHRVQPLHCGNIARISGLREPQHVRVGFGQYTGGYQCYFNQVMVGIQSGQILCADVTVTCN